MVLTQKADLELGTKNEETILSSIEALSNTSLKRLGGYSIMDYTNEAKTVYVELKTRRITHDQYPTALIGNNKVEFCSDPNKSYYFVFCYTDGIYYIKYDKELFDTFERKDDYYRRARSDCPNYRQHVCLIPISLLTKFENTL